ncbi:hypothetical protein [Streptomyces sp. NPDC127108]|uniref:hypothetical protein n=1 Tax=Streptomyces sp. NPDC127108 TaxID=3345361 RepID=UPI00362CB22B
MPGTPAARRSVRGGHAPREEGVNLAAPVVARTSPVATGRCGTSPLVAGKRLTCFSDAEEASVGLDEVVPFALESTLAERGALISTGPDFHEHAVLDQRLVTGQNPASAAEVARLVTAALRPEPALDQSQPLTCPSPFQPEPLPARR